MFITKCKGDGAYSSLNAYIFCYNYLGNASLHSKIKLYELKTWDMSGKLSRHYIPCYRKSDNVIGMYDLVNDTFYTNKGTGVFLKGQDISTSMGLDLIDYKIEGNSEQEIVVLLPTEYQELSYIESTKEQYIDTGHTPTQNTKVYAKFQLTATVANYPFGVRETSQSNICYISGGSSSWAFRFGATSGRSYGTTDTEVHEITMGIDGTYFDGEFFEQVDKSDFTCTGNLYLFALNNNGSVSRGSTKMFEFKMWEKEKLIRHYIPCYRKSDGETGMYDLVNNEFCPSEQTTPFVLGAEKLPIPTPEEPIEIESVGDKTKNLLNPNTVEDINQYIASGSGVPSVPSSGANAIWRSSDFIPVTGGTVYHFNAINSDANSAGAGWYDETKTFISGLSTTVINQNNKNITAPSKARYVRLSWRIEEEYNPNWQNTLQLEEGWEETEYEPYGYKIPVKIRGKNVFNLDVLINEGKDTGNPVYSVNNNKVTVNRVNTTGWINLQTLSLKPNTQYCLLVENATKIDIRTPDYNVKLFSQALVTSAVFTTDSTGLVCFKLFSPTDTYPYEIGYMQLEESDISTNYEPYVEPITTNIYLNEPLKRADEYSDYIDFKNQKINRVVVEKILDGTEGWKLTSNGGAKNYFHFTSGGNRYVVSHKGLCTHYQRTYISSSDTVVGYNSIRSSAGDSRVLIRPNNVTSYNAETWANFVKEQYDNGTPIIISYVLTTPTEETIELPTIPTFKGTTIIEVDTDILPSNMEVIYIGK